MTHFSLSGLRVLTDERGDDLNDLHWIKKGIAYYRAKRRGCQ
jgi:hypothetical protein